MKTTTNNTWSALAVIVAVGLSMAMSTASAASSRESQASAKAVSKKAKSAKRAKPSSGAGRSSKGKLSREVVFDGAVVNGKYLASGEAVSTVENEKTLDNLIGMRADFKDRLADQRAQLRSGSTDK